MFCILFAVLLVAFGFAVCAPGNAMRAEGCTQMNPILAILSSVFYSCVLIGDWLQLPQIVMFVFLTPLLYKLSQRCTFSFRYPLAVAALSFLVFATQLTPPLYAMSAEGPGRLINICYYAFYLLILLNVFYLCGWINHKFEFSVKIDQKTLHSLIAPSVLCMAILFVSGSFLHGIKEMTSVDTALALLNNSAQEYDAKYTEFINQVQAGQTELEDIETDLDFFVPFDISEDPEYWVNWEIAKYYGVEKIQKKTSDDDSVK